MAVVCDFVVVQGDSHVGIGDSRIVWETTFSTSGRYSGGSAILFFMVRGLTYATSPVKVKINGTEVGEIAPYRWPTSQMRDAAASHWYTQVLNIGSGILNNGDNELQIEAIGFPEATGTNKFDDFDLRDIVCFFQQSAG